MRLCWLTDIHLNFLDAAHKADFARRVGAAKADVVLVSGDIAEAPTLQAALELLDEHTTGHIAYVLGNHDFYRGSIADVRRACGRYPGTYLHQTGPVELTPTTCVVGVDGWGDGRFGSARDSDLIFTDWVLIEEFRKIDAVRDMDARLLALRKQGMESAARLEQQLREAAEKFSHIYIVTHVPPFERGAGNNGSAMAQIWVPWLACRATGEVIVQVADEYPEVSFEVLCGHTHVARVTHPRRNVVSHTGSATYRKPEIQRSWKI